MQIAVGADITFDTRDAPRQLVNALRSGLTFQNPEWTPRAKGTERWIPEYSFIGDRIAIPRGALRLLQCLLRDHRIRATWQSNVVGTAGKAMDPYRLVPTLRDYQVDAARALLEGVQGVAVIPTGGGKTYTLAAAALATCERVLVCVHTQDIADQWVKTFVAVNDRRPRLIQGSSSDMSPLEEGEIAVAMIPTLDRNASKAKRLLGSAGCLILDECHHTPASTWRAVVDHCPARFRWGCSATPEREDGWGFEIPLLLGPVLYEIKEQDLIRRGFLRSPRFVPVMSGWAPSAANYFAHPTCPLCGNESKVSNRAFMAGEAQCKAPRCGGIFGPEAKHWVGRLNFSDAQTEASSSAETGEVVVGLAKAGVESGRTVLVLAPRKSAVWAWTEELSRRGIDVIGVTSKMGKAARRRALRDVRRGRYDCLVATTLADEGLDLPTLDMGINAMSGKAQGKGRQRIGRLIRPEGKDPLMFEVVHGGAEFERQWAKRSAGYAHTFGRECLLWVDAVDADTARSVLGGQDLEVDADILT